jgi:hypothetical protein
VWPLLVPVPVAALLLVPWSALVWDDQGSSAALREAGWPARWLLEEPSRLSALAGQATSVGSAPPWSGLLLPLLATLALLPAATRRPVLAAWVVALIALVGLRLVGGLTGEDAVWAGVWAVLLVGAWATAVALAASRLEVGRVARSEARRRLPAAVGLAALAACVVPVAAAVWWMASSHETLPGGRAAVAVPLYLDEAARADPAQGTLVLTGTTRTGLVDELRRGAPTALGQEALQAASRQRAVDDALAGLVAGDDPTAVARLADAGVAALFAPDPVDAALVEALDAAPGLTPSSAASTGGRAWRLDRPGRLPRTDPSAAARARPLLLVVQGVALATVLVLAGPSRRSL